MRVLNKTEQTQLCEYILEKPEPCNIGILVCLFTGLRIGEICALRWEDISFSDQSIYIHHTLQRIQTHQDHGERQKLLRQRPKTLVLSGEFHYLMKYQIFLFQIKSHHLAIY